MTISYDVADGQRTNRAGEPQVLGPDAKKGDARLVGAKTAAAGGPARCASVPKSERVCGYRALYLLGCSLKKL